MANPLLDFVMSVVRDPDAAAHFAADPDQALLDANLTNVTSADVHALIPVVSESLASAAQAGPAASPADNVWTSGAATAAFDAFGDHLPPGALDSMHVVAGDDVITDPGLAVHPGYSGIDDVVESHVADVATDHDLHFDQPVIDDAHVHEAPPVDDWSHPVADIHHLDVDASGFDIFD